MDSGDYGFFPGEITAEILSRLPVKSLIRFRAVCKSWKSLIESCAVIAAHLHLMLQSIHQTQLLLLNHKSKCYYYSLPSSISDISDPAFSGAHSVAAAAMEIILPPIIKFQRMIGACAGLICLNFNSPYGTMILNPCMRKYVILPKPRNGAGWQTETKLFGYDSRTNDYKVLRILAKSQGDPFAVSFELYSLAQGCWKTLGDAAVVSLPNYCLGSGRVIPVSVVLNGALHWVQQRLGVRNVIVSFHFDSESFTEMMMPEDLRGDGPCLILKCEESLALCHAECISHNTVHNYWLHVWFMKKDGVRTSWTKLDQSVHLKEEDVGDEFPFFEGTGPLYFKSRDELVFCVLDRNRMETTTKVVDFRTRETTTIGNDERICDMLMDPLVESLVLLSHPDAVSY